MSAVRTETRLPGANNEEELVPILEHWLPGIDLEPHLDAYDRSYWVLRSYLLKVYSTYAAPLLGREGNLSNTPAQYRADVQEVLMLPGLSGLDTSDPQIKDWVLFLCHHWSPHNGITTQLGRFLVPADAYRAIEAVGVPFEYLSAFDRGPARTPVYPLSAVLDAWDANVPVEYAQEAIYGGSA